MIIRSIPLCNAQFLLATDASWANTSELKSQGGYMTLFTEKEINKGKEAVVSPLRWKTYKLERPTQSTLGAELMSLARGLAECEWMRSLFAEALNFDYKLERTKNLGKRLASR